MDFFEQKPGAARAAGNDFQFLKILIVNNLVGLSMCPKPNDMRNEVKPWSKAEMQVYILLLCANADSNVTHEELEVIQTKADEEIFKKMYAEFTGDSEEISLQKIQENLVNHEYSHKELVELRKEMFEVFFADKKFSRMEKTLEKILNNILY